MATENDYSMNRPLPNQSRIRANGVALRERRKATGYTQEALHAACIENGLQLSLSSVRRAEQGHKVNRSTLTRIAEVLNVPPDHLIEKDQQVKESVGIDLTGQWYGLYVEADRAAKPRLMEEQREIIQSGTNISGTLVLNSASGTRTEIYREVQLVGNVLSGWVELLGYRPPYDRASIMEAVSRNGDWLEGFSTWFDPDAAKIEISRVIAIRTSSQMYERFISDAKSILEKEISTYSFRKLVELNVDPQKAFDVAFGSGGPADRS